MKIKSVVIATLSLFAGVSVVAAQDAGGSKEVTVTYNVNRIPGPGSNQIAVWVENGSGDLIRSLYASKFTADGGYKRRPVSLSEWTKKADWENASKEEVDAVSGSTQSAGENKVIWDLKDKSGKPVPEGTYVIRLEANIKNEQKMFYSGKIAVGENNSSADDGVITYSAEGLEGGSQIFSDVKVEYK